MAGADLHATMRLFQYVDGDGRRRSVWIEADTARELENLERRYRRAEAKHHARHVRLSELSSRLGYPLRLDELERAKELLKRHRREFDDFGNRWEGPRFDFPWLVGESRTWNGDPMHGAYCEFCGGSPLPSSAYCLGCDRTGRELEIPAPTAADLKARRGILKPKNDGLKGGRS